METKIPPKNSFLISLSYCTGRQETLKYFKLGSNKMNASVWGKKIQHFIVTNWWIIHGELNVEFTLKEHKFN